MFGVSAELVGVVVGADEVAPRAVGDDQDDVRRVLGVADLRLEVVVAGAEAERERSGAAGLQRTRAASVESGGPSEEGAD